METIKRNHKQKQKLKVKMELSDYFKEKKKIKSDLVEISNKLDECFLNVGP